MLKNMIAKTLLGSTIGVAIIAGYAVMQDLGPDSTFFFDTATPFAAADAADKIPAIQINTRHRYHQRLATQLATGEGAGGVVAVDARFVGAFVNARRFENLSDPAYDAAALAGGRADQAWQQGQDAKGNQYAIPVNIGPRVMYYRRDVLASIGAEIDDVVGSWETYIDYGRALKDQGIYLVGDAADVADVIINATIQDGEGLYFDAEGHSLLTSVRFVAAFQTARIIREEGLDGQIRAWSTEWYDAFAQGTVATQVSGAWLLGHLQSWMPLESGDLLGASHFPNGVQGAWGDSFLAIPKEADDKQAAWGFIKYLLDSEETTLSGLKTNGACTVVKGALDSVNVEAEMTPAESQYARGPVVEVVQIAAAAGPMDRDLIAKDIVDAALDDVLNNGKGIMTALAEADSRLALALR